MYKELANEELVTVASISVSVPMALLLVVIEGVVIIKIKPRRRFTSSRLRLLLIYVFGFPPAALDVTLSPTIKNSASSLATGQCSTPFGTTNISSSCNSTSLSLN